MTFLLLVLTLLAIPLSLTFKVSWHQSFAADIRLRWLFGLVRIPLSLTPSPQPGKAQKGPRCSSSTASRKRSSFAVLRQKAFRKRIWGFIHDIWQAIEKKDLMLQLRIGLGDPADTGRLWAVAGPIAGMLSTARETRVQLEPDFFNQTIELDSHGEIRIVPLQILYLTAALLLSSPVRQALTSARRI